MNAHEIKINDFWFQRHTGRPFTEDGILSQRELAGIEIKASIDRNDEEKLKSLLAQDTVEVEDPFVQRKYSASIKQKMNTYRDGSRIITYTLEVLEKDDYPNVSILEIDGEQYEVMAYRESVSDKEKRTIGRHALLKLSHEQLIILQDKIDKKQKPVMLRRIGVDDEALPVRYGGGQYWSKHQDGEEMYFKQIVRFFPADDIPEKSPLTKIAIRADQKILMRRWIGLAGKLEALLHILKQNNLLDQDQYESLLPTNNTDDWYSYLPEESRTRLAWELSRIDDAAEELD